MSRDQFEVLSTVQFTMVTSTAPDSAPVLEVTDIADSVTSLTSVASNTTHYYALYTAPNTPGTYMGRWTAVATFSGSAYNFKKSFLFEVLQPKRVI